MIRYAIVSVPEGTDVHRLTRTIERYTPHNYGAVAVVHPNGEYAVLVLGVDVAGWTMQDYVAPRLASGNYGSREITPAEAAELAEVAA